MEFEKNEDGSFKLDGEGKQIRKGSNAQPPSSSKNKAILSAEDIAALRSRRRRTEFKGSDLLSCPGKEYFAKIGLQDQLSSLVASDKAIKAIEADWVEYLKVPAELCYDCAFDVAWFCYNNSSSSKQLFTENSRSGIPLTDLVSTVRVYSTLRQFCSRYAPLVWNFGIENNCPPANWQRRRINEGAKFAAFDFFEAVCNPSAQQPNEGLIRSPTSLEMLAGATVKELAVRADEIRRGYNSTLDAAITGGRSGAIQDLKQIGQS